MPTWKIAATSVGGTALYRAIPDSVMEWTVTDPEAPSMPSWSQPCTLTLWIRGDVLLMWHCSCVAEAVQIAEGAEP